MTHAGRSTAFDQLLTGSRSLHDQRFQEFIARSARIPASINGVEGRLASLSTAVTQVKIDIERKRSLSPTGEGLPAVQAAQAAGFREGLQWALSLLDSHISDTVLHAADDEARKAGERTAAARHAARG